MKLFALTLALGGLLSFFEQRDLVFQVPQLNRGIFRLDEWSRLPALCWRSKCPLVPDGQGPGEFQEMDSFEVVGSEFVVGLVTDLAYGMEGISNLLPNIHLVSDFCNSSS